MDILYSRDSNTTLLEKLDLLPHNTTIVNSFIKTFRVVNDNKYRKIACSISGGWDSTVMLDIVHKCDLKHKVDYYFIDTGIEFDATKKFIDYLSKKYNIKIKVIRPDKPIPTAVNEHGLPFISKQCSEYIMRLQAKGFKFEDDTFENLVKKYCKRVYVTNGVVPKGCVQIDGEYYQGCVSALEWWCNRKGDNSFFNIKRNSYLKEFLIANPPTFPISSKCCYYAKKKPANQMIKLGYELNLVGTRKAEGGVRRTAYKNCMSIGKTAYWGDDGCVHYCDEHRPLWFSTKEDRKQYTDHLGIELSDCYKTYGMCRTGCAGCPLAKDYRTELEIIKNHEPKLAKAVYSIFKKSYEYTEMYRAFQKEMREKN